MPATTETISLGQPVEFGQIERELKKLWSESDGAMTRASLINLAVYSEEEGALARNTRLIEEVTEQHACRAIVIEARPEAEKNESESWINAHCHLRSGGKQVCSEQISFLLPGAATKMLASVLFAHLDSDLPLYLWWQAALPTPIDPQLWPWVDRLIFDSQSWKDFPSQWKLAEQICREANERMVLCDLNWTRLQFFRLALAQFFDHPTSHHHFATVEEVTVTHGRGYRSTAMLFVAWLAAQLDWEVGKKGDGLTLAREKGGPGKISFREEGSAPLMAVVARSGEVLFEIERAACGDLLKVGRGYRGKKFSHQMLPAGANEPARLLTDELLRGGPHRVYLAAVAKLIQFS